MVGHSQQKFMTCKSALAGLTALYDKILGFSDYRTIVDVIFFDFIKASNIVSHNTLISKYLDITEWMGGQINCKKTS